MARTEIIVFSPGHHRKRLAILALGAALVIYLEAGLAAGVYRWVDEQGKVHYGDRPPKKEASTPIEIESAPVPAPDDDERRRKTRRLLEAIESERDRNKQEEAQAKADKARQETNCRSARRRVELFQRANNISRRGPDGERTYLDEKEREQALAQARSLVDRWCK